MLLPWFDFLGLTSLSDEFDTMLERQLDSMLSSVLLDPLNQSTIESVYQNHEFLCQMRASSLPQDESSCDEQLEKLPFH